MTKYSTRITKLPNKGKQTLPELDNSISAKFVQEAKIPLFHYCRALAMKAAALASNQQYNEAIAVVYEMKSLYDPTIHSSAIATEYARDHCAASIAASALYYQHVNLFEEAMEVCEDVIARILPELEKANVNGNNWLSLTALMIPCTQALRKQGQDGAKMAWELFSAHVVEPFTSAGINQPYAKSFMRPLSILLKCCSMDTYDGSEEDGDWMLDGSGNKVTVGNESYTTSVLSVSFFSILSEVCLHLAKRLDGDERKRALVAEGLRYSNLVEPKMKDKEGKVTNGIVFEAHAPIEAELARLSKMMEYKQSGEGVSLHKLSIEDSAKQPDKKLPV